MFITLSSCDVNEPKKEKPKPEGYQEDIPWPSLADSPWPMFQHDPQNTGRSSFEFPNQILFTKNEIYSNNLLAGCVLGEDALLFNNSNPSKLFSYNEISNTKNWEKDLAQESLTAPIISKEGLYTSSQNQIYAFSNNGDTLWSLSIDTKYIYQRTFNIDKLGNIYVIFNKNIYKIDSKGIVLNQFHDNDIDDAFNTSAFSPDGNTIYVQGKNSDIISIDINSFNINWKYGDNSLYIPPVVDSYGNIYLLTKINSNPVLISLDKNGTFKWKFEHSQDIEASSYPVITKYGDIVFGFDTLFSVSYKGKLKWKKSLSTRSNFKNPITSITTDKCGNLLVGTESHEVILLDKEGNEKSRIELQTYGKGALPIIYSGKSIIAPFYKGEKIFILN